MYYYKCHTNKTDFFLYKIYVFTINAAQRFLENTMWLVA